MEMLGETESTSTIGSRTQCYEATDLCNSAMIPTQSRHPSNIHSGFLTGRSKDWVEASPVHGVHRF